MTWRFRHDDICMQQLKATGKEESASIPHALLAVAWWQPNVTALKLAVSNSQSLRYSQAIDIFPCQKASTSRVLPSHSPFHDVQKEHSQNKITQDEINLHSLTQPVPPTQAVVLKTLHSNSANFFFSFFFGKHALLLHKLCTRHVTQEVSQWNRKWPVHLCVFLFLSCISFAPPLLKVKLLKKNNNSPSRSTSCWRLWVRSLLCNFLPLEGRSAYRSVCTRGLRHRLPCGEEERKRNVRR